MISCVELAHNDLAICDIAPSARNRNKAYPPQKMQAFSWYQKFECINARTLIIISYVHIKFQQP